MAKPAYRIALNASLAWHRLIDSFFPKDRGDITDITLIIKTFERPYALKRLISSIQRRYASIKIIVVDDSKQPVDIEGVELIKLPYDSGISAGRNAALARCQTPYFLLLDDDFVFSHRQRLSSLCAYMKTHDEVDIMGGRCIDLPMHIKHHFHDHGISKDLPAKIAIGNRIGGMEVVDKVQNYFIGRTETIRTHQWNPALKIAEHTEFFTRARGKLVTVYNPSMLILHVKWPFDLAYNRKRFRTG